MRDIVESAAALIVMVIVVAFVGAIVFLTADRLAAHAVVHRVAVLEKHYTPSRSSTSIAVTGGKQGVVPVFTDEAEAFTLLISRDGQTESRHVGANTYAHAEVGREIDLTFHVGRWTSHEY